MKIFCGSYMGGVARIPKSYAAYVCSYRKFCLSSKNKWEGL